MKIIFLYPFNIKSKDFSSSFPICSFARPVLPSCFQGSKFWNFFCVPVQRDQTGYCKIVNNGAWLGGYVNQSLKSWPCFEVRGRVPTVINASANAASVAATKRRPTAVSDSACSQQRAAMWAWLGGEGQSPQLKNLWAIESIPDIGEVFLSLPLSLTYFEGIGRSTRGEGGIFVFAFQSDLGFTKDRSVLAGGGLAVMHLTCCLGLLVFLKRGGRRKQVTPEFWLETLPFWTWAMAEKLNCSTPCRSA